MAGSGRKDSAGRAADMRGRDSYYIEGTAVRRMEAVPEIVPEERHEHKTSLAARKNRERALQMNVGYVIFLTAAAVLTMYVCITFLQLRAQNTLLQKQVTSLKTELDAAVLENDSDYNRVMTSVDLSHVRDVAENELGMVQAQEGQIVTYEVEDGDYVRQYTDIPEE